MVAHLTAHPQTGAGYPASLLTEHLHLLPLRAAALLPLLQLFIILLPADRTNCQVRYTISNAALAPFVRLFRALQLFLLNLL
jgi:hypothetical protein